MPAVIRHNDTTRPTHENSVMTLRDGSAAAISGTETIEIEVIAPPCLLALKSIQARRLYA